MTNKTLIQLSSSGKKYQYVHCCWEIAIKKIVLFCCFTLFALGNIIAQSITPICGTTGSENAIGPLGNGLISPPSGPLFLRIYVYKLGNDAGQHMPTDDQIHESISILRRDFESHNIFFVWDCQIEEFRNSELSNLIIPPIPDPNLPRPDCVLSQYVSQNDGISIFIGGDNTGYMGVATDIPGEALLVKGIGSIGGTAFIASRSPVISHEMGHCLGLWHTHGHFATIYCDGSSGGPSPCDEFVDGSNGFECGDYVPDTPADPELNASVIIQQGCNYTGSQLDPLGLQYDPDPTLIMSYTHPDCMNAEGQGHTEGQGERMRHVITTDAFLQNCLVEPNFTDIVINTGTPSGTTIFPSTVWDISNTPNNGEVLIDYSLTIENGATLTINPGVTVRFGEQGRLIIKPNAHLILYGTLTSMGCTQGWEGVEVWGSHFSTNQSQYNVNGIYAQGRLTAYSFAPYQSVIENARTSVKLYGPTINYSGGQIYCYGTLFRNNGKGAIFAEYQNYNPYPFPVGQQGQPRPYRSYFSNCTFVIDDIYPHATPFYSFIHLDAVDGVSISGCTFSNDQFIEGDNITDWGYGIYAIDAGFNVRGIPNAIPCPFPCYDVKNTEFNRLGYGIYVKKALTNRPILIKESTFRECFVGLRNTSMAGTTVILNDFELGSVPSSIVIPITDNPSGDDGQQHQIGIIFETDIAGWECQENTFIKTSYNTNNTTIGIMSLATGDGSKTIRKNDFISLSIGNLAYKNNITEGLGGSEGLLYECNRNYNGNGKDFYVPAGWIKKDQGVALTPGPSTFYQSAGNRFSYTGIDFSCFLDTSAIFNFVRYHYNPGGQNEYPQILEGDIHDFPAESNMCASILCDPPCREETELPDLKTAFYSNKSAYLATLADFNFAPSVQKEARLDYHRRLMAENAYAIVLYSMYDTIAYQTDTLITWIKNLGTLSSMVWAAKEQLASGNTLAAHQLLIEATNQYPLTLEQITDMNHCGAIIDLLAGKQVYALDELSLDAIREYLYNGIEGYASAWAENILTANDEYFPPDYILEEVEERNEEEAFSPFKPSKPETARLKIIPNPASDKVLFQVSPFGYRAKAILQIYDLTGNLQAIFPDVSENSDVNWQTGTASSGMYFYRLTVDGQIANSGKIILNK